MKKFLLSAVLFLFFYPSYAVIFDCNSTSDANGNAATRTLRYCITQANSTGAKDTINFSVSGTWTVASNYPVISNPLYINGYSAPGVVQGQLGAGTRVLTVVLNGPGNSLVYGFDITASNCEISGLVLQDFYKGIYIDGGSNNWIWGCYIGTAANGLSIATTTTCYDDAIALNNNANNNIIGTNGNGTNDANEGNLLTGNGDSGVQFTGEGIAINEGGTIANDCSGNRISGNFIGTNETGTTALYPGATEDLQRGSGVQINYSTANIIGTNGDGVSDALERNIISGNSDCGIVLAGATGNKIKGNYIGTTKTGLVGLPNYGNEGTKLNAVQITVKLGSNNNYIGTDGDGVNDNIEGNIFGSATIANAAANISYNYTVFNSGSTGNRYSGNYFGIGADGTTVLDIKTTGGPFIDKCIYISGGSTSTIVGTNGDGVSDAFESNYFGNSGIGVGIDNSNSCVVAGNYFGLGTNLTTAETLTTSGVYILNAASGRIGSSAANSLERNYFCNSNQYGIWIDGNATANNDLNTIRYNTIGMRPDGVTASNGYNGIYIYRQSNSNTIESNIISKNGTSSATGAYGAIQIGGANANEQSTLNTVYNNNIYKNIGPGIQVQNSGSTGNKISQNSIYNNGNAGDAAGKYKLGIDLNADNVTANDNVDPDTGPNDLLNFPIITAAIPGGASCSQLLKGTFNGLANTQYYIEIFSSDVCNGDTSGLDYYANATYNFGEGRTYQGTTSTFTTDASGNANWSIALSIAALQGQYVTAAAIQANGAGINNTSEFSKCYYITYDCGDAPDTYHTLLSNCGPVHLNTSANLKIGSTFDNDTDGVPTVNADGDGADEDGISAFPALTALSTSYTISAIPVTNSSGTTATLYAWLDFNVNGSFEASEFASVSVPSSGAQSVNLTWSSLSCGTNIIPGNAYLRLRLTTTALSDNGGTATVDERSYGEADDGEVEDYKIYIPGYDYGDLPATYPIAKALCLEDTATAKVWGGVTKPSRECSQKFSPDAFGDGAEEDALTTSIGPGGTTNNWVVRLSANQASKTVYYGLWLDWNGDGNFTTTAPDVFFSGSAVVTGSANVNVAVTTPFLITNAMFRLIISDAPLTSGMYNTTITNGEVEDYSFLRILASTGNILTGKKQEGNNLLKWKNTTALQITNFTIERSADNLSWITLGSVAPLPGDNSSEDYTFIDVNPAHENYYRLKFSLDDSSYQYSNIVPLSDNSTNIAPVIIYPNPATNTLIVQIPDNNYTSLKIFALTGNIEMSQEIKGMRPVIDISNLATGTHLIKFITKTGEEIVQRFVKIK